MRTITCFADRTRRCTLFIIGPLQEPVTWYGINYAWTLITQWDFQNKGKSGWTGTSSFALEVGLRYLRPSVIYSVPCDSDEDPPVSNGVTSLLVFSYHCVLPVGSNFT